MTVKIISFGFLSLGTMILMQVLLPIISFKLWEIGQRYNNGFLISPKIPQKNQILGVTLETQDNFPAFVSNKKREVMPSYSRFSLSISRLGINEAEVFLDSNDLSLGLIHLPGSALPGERGNIFISGHSALSRLLMAKSAYFAKLPDMKIGDKIILKAAGIQFIYQAIETKVVDPIDLSVISAPEPQGRYLTLMTCVPPGLNLKRLIVLGKLI